MRTTMERLTSRKAEIDMRLITFNGGSVGAVSGDDVWDLSARIGASSVKDLIQDLTKASGATGGEADFKLSEITLSTIVGTMSSSFGANLGGVDFPGHLMRIKLATGGIVPFEIADRFGKDAPSGIKRF